MRPKALLPLLPALLATLTAARAAEAQEGKAVEVTVRPGGQPWSIGDRGAGMECSPTCILHLTPRSYRISMGETTEDVYIDAPSEIAYRPPVRPLRYAGGALMGVGLVAGGVLTFAAAMLCTGQTMTLPDGTTTYVSKTCEKPLLSRTGQYALIGAGAGSFAAAVVGGILFYLGGESIKVRDLAPSPRTSARFTFDVSGQGASVGWSLRF
jgi:hypothetical protein